MKITINSTVVILSLVGLSSSVVAQDKKADTSQMFQSKSFRTLSIGLNGGMLTHWTPFDKQYNGDYRTPQKRFGYSAYLKEQLLPDFGIQADFLFGRVAARRANILPSGSTAQDNSGFKTDIHWSAALNAVLTIPNLSLNQKHHPLIPYLTAGAGYMSSSANPYNTPYAFSTNDEKNWFINGSAGFKVGLSRNINLDLGYNVYVMRTNNFDGYRSGLNDHFSYAHAGLEFLLGKRNKPQLQNYGALAELHDLTKMEIAELDVKIQTKLTDEAQKRVADEQQYLKDLGDDDNDGVANKFDKCPGTPINTAVDGSGCPLKIPVAEKVIITESDRRTVGDAIQNLEFDLGKATIKKRSFETLDRVADLLIQKNFGLKLAGHTDNSGSRARNWRLSKARAEAVKAYLVAKGANASRIEATGYGQAQPVTTNKTKAGRQKNRRVEFTLL
jgi:OOP family OmpA-OmpF porin